MRNMLIAALLLGQFLLVGCPPRLEPLTPKLQGWCAALSASLAKVSEGGAFKCLTAPNILSTGFYGPKGNPAQHSFLQSCFAGDAVAYKGLHLAPQPIADTWKFSYKTEATISSSGGLDLSSLSKWAPSLKLGGGAAGKVDLTVSLTNPTFITLSSPGAVLARVLASARDASQRKQLSRCIASLCDAATFYTARTLSASPEIRLSFSDSRSFEALAGIKSVANFNITAKNSAERTVTLTGKGAVAVAALLRPSKGAMEGDGACRPPANGSAKDKPE